MKLSHIERKYDENFGSRMLSSFFEMFQEIRKFRQVRDVFLCKRKKKKCNTTAKKKKQKHFWRKQVFLFRENIYIQNLINNLMDLGKIC